MFSASIRKNSFNKKLINITAKEAEDQENEVTLIDLADYPMPIYNGDSEESDGTPENAQNLCKLIGDHDYVIISSPEYNGFPSPLLKNTIDWVSRVDREVYKNKKFVIISASPGGLGGVRGLMYLRILLNNLNAIVIPQQLSIGNSSNAFNAEGNLVNKNDEMALKSLINGLAT